MKGSGGPGLTPEKIVLVAVLRRPLDLEIAARRRWYRIPVGRAPKRPFTHLAFYQPACFGPDGKRIVRYAEVAGRSVARRLDLLPGEPGHPAAEKLYLRYSLGPLLRLPLPLLNTCACRITFGYVPLERLRRAKDLPGAFNMFRAEHVMRIALEAAGLAFRREYAVLSGSRVKYRLDFALVRGDLKLAVECDGRSHAAPARRAGDAERDAWLRRNGWIVLRFSETALANPGACVEIIKKAIG